MIGPVFDSTNRLMASVGPIRSWSAERNAVLSIQQRLSREAVGFDREISSTPTGELRNRLTEANIHLLLAIEAMKWILTDWNQL